MIRRFSTRALAASAAAVAAVGLSGCATFSDADVAARVGERELTDDDFADALRPLAPPGEHEVGGAQAASLLSRWIDNEITRAALTDLGVSLPGRPTELTESSLQTEATELSTFIVDAIDANPPDGEALVDDYAGGVLASGIACPAIIAVYDEALLPEVEAALGSGSPFLEVAASELNTDPQLAADAGRLGCTALDLLRANNPPEVTAAIEASELGEHVGPYQIEQTAAAGGPPVVLNFWLMNRPADDVDPAELVDTARDPQLVQYRWRADADVYVDPRYGRFDPLVGLVPLG